MALAKVSTPITQLTTTSTSIPVAVSGGVAPLVSLLNDNGTGVITVGATAQIQYQVNGALRWYSLAVYLITFGTTTSATESRAVSLPDSVTGVRISYTVPTGAASPKLDAEISYVTP